MCRDRMHCCLVAVTTASLQIETPPNHSKLELWFSAAKLELVDVGLVEFEYF